MLRRVIILYGIIALLMITLLPIKPQEKEKPPPTISVSVSVQIPLYVEVGNIYEGYQMKFTEPFEVAYFVFSNGTVIKFTNTLVDRIFFPDLVSLFKTLKLEFGELIIVIHNHLFPCGFSKADIHLCQRLRKLGFNGKFQIYFPHNNRVITYVGK